MAVQRPYIGREEADGSVRIVEAQSVVKKPVVGQWFVAAQSVGELVVEPFVGWAAAGIVAEMGLFVGEEAVVWEPFVWLRVVVEGTSVDGITQRPVRVSIRYPC